MKFHTAVVGSGSGGLTVAVGLTNMGKEVALIEKDKVGGDCTNVGCIPSKSLIHGSFQYQSGTKSAAEVLAEVREKRDHLRREETGWVKDLQGLTFFSGHARFIDNHTLEVTDGEGKSTLIEAKNIVLSTGSRPRHLRIPGLSSERVLTNETIFDLEAPPAHLAVVGGGVIGSELSLAFRRLGSQVSLIDTGDRLLRVSEPEASQVVQERFEKAGIALHFNTRAESYDEKNRTLTLGSGHILKGVDKVLLAAGRVPNLDLDLEKAGVEYSERGVKTDGMGRTSVGHIFAIGDINLNSAFTHSANHQGRSLVRKLGFPFLPDSGPEPLYPSCTFTEPEVAQVGPTREQLLTSHHPHSLRTIRFDLADTDRGYTMDLQEGFVQLHCQVLTGRLLAATVVAPSAGEMLSLLTFAVNNKVSLYKLADLVFPYPVLSEAIKKGAHEYMISTLKSAPKELYRYLRYGLLGFGGSGGA